MGPDHADYLLTAQLSDGWSFHLDGHELSHTYLSFVGQTVLLSELVDADDTSNPGCFGGLSDSYCTHFRYRVVPSQLLSVLNR